MRAPEVLVRFQPANREVYVLPGARLVEAAARAGLVLEVPCGGEALCGKCRVRVVSGAGEPNAAERRWFSDVELQAGWRLACQSTVAESMAVEVPTSSLAAGDHKILVEKRGQNYFSPQKSFLPVRKRYVELPTPTRGDDLPDMLRLERALNSGPLEIDVSLLRELPARLRRTGFRGTAVLMQLPGVACRLLDFEEGDTEADAYAVAFDIGTTTLVGELLDLGSGDPRAVEAALNPQTRFGDDVLSRIGHARQGADGLRQLHETITGAVDEMIDALCRRAGVSRERIYEMTVAGNTTMQQLFLGVDPSPLGEIPFTPAGGRGLACEAAELGIRIHPRGRAYVLPVIGGFLGGDTVAGLVATDLADAEKPTLFIDIGTNGEIVLAAGGTLRAASTAAGPAFEGARISCGMRGCTGAIEKVIVCDGRLQIGVIGDVPPVGLCGSGLIDAAAELLRHGLLTPEGRLVSPDQLAPGTPPDLAGRLVMHDRKPAFRLAAEDETADRRPIVLTQQDIRELQLAAGAIRAGVVILLRRAGLDPADLDRVLIGGGFGNFIRRDNAQRIGLLPHQIEHRRIRFMGNTSLAGARLAALSVAARQQAEALARRVEPVDLSTDREFHRVFAESMIFPEA